ncbi:type III-A CRISPR-associated protein Cas10/Csm1 [Thermosediminibacter litoriperuensis]|uniref:CRISPR system single-strand-specific deoxyribonuclease Cas10/Csm1 (subtype III-A) n=1 Tax=Thermosediminibacter litoriperuensis TaxID=291989 RepID=A0A5S5AU19_9FIRM|nr:type III-A CRISPR-associated protein Cas10/Csm1 [Thermosediminibacter litoriperuensis]TYP55422.1 CRISPR-associated protein Csm1 [Thermosediminibacter litoriperuensis]
MAFLFNNFTAEERNLLLAALLHDIGKFGQRTQDESMRRIVSENYRAFYEARNHSSPGHQDWSAYFCETFVKIREVTDAVLNHHGPSERLHYFVSAGDCLSAGERLDIAEEKGGEIRQLVSILSCIELDGLRAKKAYYKKLVPLGEYCVPEEEPSPNPKQGYKELWDAFVKAFKSIQNFDDPVELTKLYSTLEEYTFNIPSAYYYSMPDISLWAHLKTTAAIAFALYRELEGKPKQHVISKLDSIIRHPSAVEEDLFCLVKGDISGIQDFVYDTKMDGATKALRGKSFYLSYLMTVIPKYILKKERLPITNLLYSGGGHFYLIMHGRFLQKLDEYQKELDGLFLDAHHGKLALLLKGVTLKPADFRVKDGKLPEKFEELGKLLQEEKNRKFYSILKEDQKMVFGPFKEKGEPCPHCGNPVKEDECPFCRSFERLGENLIKKKFLVEEWKEKSERQKGSIEKVEDIFKRLGVSVEFTDEALEKDYSFAVKREEWDIKKCCGYMKIPVGMKLDQKGNIITFDEISDSAKGIKVWGVLRGDVDNLGRIFREGLGQNRSFARIMTLSQEMAQFFGPSLERMLNRLGSCDKSHSYEKCAVIYAGGDDFFLVGPWDAMPYVAEEIKKEFYRYTGLNPAITVSMAFDIAPDKKFPLYRVAQTAGENLENAKHFKDPVRKKEKNCFAFAGVPIGWEDFDKFKDVKEKLSKALDELKVSRSLLGIIYRVCREYEVSANEDGKMFRSWRLFYYIARLKERNKKAEDILDKLIDLLIEKGNKLYKYAFQSARWAEFETRK